MEQCLPTGHPRAPSRAARLGALQQGAGIPGTGHQARSCQCWQGPQLPCPPWTRWSQQEHKTWEEYWIQRIWGLPRQSELKQNNCWKKFFIFEGIPELRKPEANLQFMDLGTLGWSDQAAARPHTDQPDTFPPLEQSGSRESSQQLLEKQTLTVSAILDYLPADLPA